MQTIGIKDYHYNSFNFSMTTSSGDKISLDLYDEKSSSFLYAKSTNSKFASVSLSHSYGYHFHYEGDGIDKNDKREIDEALKIIKPMLEQYFDNINKSSQKTTEADIVNRAFDINSKLPQIKNEDAKYYLNHKTLKMMDNILAKPENKNNLKSAQKLFDELLRQMEGFKLYM